MIGRYVISINVEKSCPLCHLRADINPENTVRAYQEITSHLLQFQPSRTNVIYGQVLWNSDGFCKRALKKNIFMIRLFQSAEFFNIL